PPAPSAVRYGSRTYGGTWAAGGRARPTTDPIAGGAVGFAPTMPARTLVRAPGHPGGTPRGGGPLGVGDGPAEGDRGHHPPGPPGPVGGGAGGAWTSRRAPAGGPGFRPPGGGGRGPPLRNTRTHESAAGPPPGEGRPSAASSRGRVRFRAPTAPTWSMFRRVI